ncbi:hypothetical protein V6C27_13800 [Peptococcaceae bacterium 1198_IL3148]
METKLLLVLKNKRVENYFKDKLPEVEIYTGDVSMIDDLQFNIAVITLAPKEAYQALLEKVRAVKEKVDVLVVALGEENEESKFIYEKLVDMGVNEKLIITSKPGKKVTSSQLVKGVQNAIELLPDEEDDPPLWDEEDPEIEDEENINVETITEQPSARGKIVSFFSLKRGSGCTTVATSFAGHITDAGLKVALVDFGEPPTASFHLGINDPAEVEPSSVYSGKWGELIIPRSVGDFHGMFEEVKYNYDVIVINYPGKILPFPECDFSVVVLDTDLQSIELLIKQNKLLKYCSPLYLVNKNNPHGVPVDVITKDIIGVKPFCIESDYEACLQALSNGAPAITKSSTMASTVGKLVAELGLLVC